MRRDALELLATHGAEDSLCETDDRMLRIAAGGEGVWLRVGRYGDLRHGQAGPLAQPIDHLVKLRRVLGLDRLCAIGAQDHPIAEPVHPEVEQAHEDERGEQRAGTARRIGDTEDEGGHRRHETKDLGVITHTSLLGGCRAARG